LKNSPTRQIIKGILTCYLTCGLEAELTIARVMLRRNVDGLVNGAIRTVTTISASAIMVKFDHINEPCPIEMVKRKFLLMKIFYAFCKQFPLTISYPSND